MPHRHPLRRSLPLALGSLLLAVTLGACSLDGRGDDEEERVVFDFTDGGAEGWSAGFADYPSNTPETDYELDSGLRSLPEEVGSGTGYMITGSNHSDDLFMFITGRLDGLEPSTTYALRFEVEVASEAQSDCVGVGGAPGESVYLKAGAAAEQPVVRVENEVYTVSVDKGQQSMGGANAAVLGHIANGDPCGSEPRFRTITRRGPDRPLEVKSAADGSLWILVGTDSGFEATTTLYYQRVTVTYEPAD